MLTWKWIPVLVVGCSEGSGSRTATDAPADAPAVDTAFDSPTEESPLPPGCEPVTVERALQEVTGEGVGPYLIRHPVHASNATTTVLFLPGGDGSQWIANEVWDRWLRDGDSNLDFRVIVPFATGGESLYSDPDALALRLIGLLDHMHACYGGAARVHLGGTSNGGIMAFAMVLAYPDRFITLLGAPGDFTDVSDTELVAGLSDKAVFLGVGELDLPEWTEAVTATHERMVRLGLNVVMRRFVGEAHVLSYEFDENQLFDFWRFHSGLAAGGAGS